MTTETEQPAAPQPVQIKIYPEEYQALADVIKRAPVSRAEGLFVSNVMARLGAEIADAMEARKTPPKPAQRTPDKPTQRDALIRAESDNEPKRRQLGPNEHQE